MIVSRQEKWVQSLVGKWIKKRKKEGKHEQMNKQKNRRNEQKIW